MSKISASKKNSARKPKIAKMFEKKTIYGSKVTEKIAGIESNAKIMSEISIKTKTKNSGVANHNFSRFLIKKCSPTKRGNIRKCFDKNLITG